MLKKKFWAYSERIFLFLMYPVTVEISLIKTKTIKNAIKIIFYLIRIHHLKSDHTLKSSLIRVYQKYLGEQYSKA